MKPRSGTSRTDLPIGAIFTISAVYHVGTIMTIDTVLHIGAIHTTKLPS
jgi:hypothetical protein